MNNISLNDIQEYLPLLVSQANVDQIRLFPSGFIPVSLNHEADTISSNKDVLNAIQQKLQPAVPPPLGEEEEEEEESDEKVIDESDVARLKETSQRLRDNLALFQITLKQIPETQLDFLERLSAQENSHEEMGGEVAQVVELAEMTERIHKSISKLKEIVEKFH